MSARPMVRRGVTSSSLVGLVVGGIIGMHVGKRELWQPVRLRVSVAPDPRSGLRLGFAIPLR